MSLITNLSHAYAVAISDLKKIAKFVETKALPLLKAAQADAPTVEAITGLVDPQLVNVERVGEAVLGTIIAAIEAAEAVSTAGVVNLTLDAQLVSDVKAIIPAVKKFAQPVPPVAVATAAAH